MASPLTDISPEELKTTSSTSLSDKSEKTRISAPADDLLAPLDEKPRFTDLIFHRSKFRTQDPKGTATRRSVYDDPQLAKHYWPSAKYENVHRFDPKARWTFEEETAVVRVLDWRVLLWAAIVFFAYNIDISNLNQANSDNFLPDLGLSTDDFNFGNTVHTIAFLVSEVPSQLISKKLGPDRWIPIQICLWSIVSLSQFWLSGRTGFLVCRAILGIVQGGFIPDLTLYLSYFYTKTELPIRVTLLWTTFALCNIVSSFLSLGILHMRGVLGRAGWRWLFLIEGAISLAIGAAAFFLMCPSPTQTKSWLWPRGWFNEREETILVSRLLRDDPAKGGMHNREGLSIKQIWTAICDYDLWPLYIIGLTFEIPVAPPFRYLTLSLRSLGFDTVATNLLTVPYACFSIITTFSSALLSEAVNDRAIISMTENVWALPCLIALYYLPAKPNPWAYYAIATVLLSAPSTLPIHFAWCSRNSGAVAGRTVGVSLFSFFFQTNTILTMFIYRADDAPRYKRGNSILVAICALNVVVLYPGAKLYYMWRNRQRARVWDAMTSEERERYLRTTTDTGNKRLDFRFAH